ncbi:type II secretion system protein GspM [Ramlibacter sp. H39-3-26]|uniref:type II secretion system protein GspM n=1 Tax=Curvibacter soli TaxID=3031331 RepID=UPI0023DC5ADD|nr:type II secretion system protein GspM [Ramlibacter sp. H39-3-26]MDF1483720.1 type II secretion system protein GspM [Ramlibacter sp. H39-3-26]
MNAVLAVLRARWAALAARERTLAASAALLVAAALLWWTAIAPAVGVLHAAPAQHAALDAQMQRMQALRSQALQLQGLPRASRADAQRALEAAVQQTLGATARLSIVGDRATVALQNADADALARWLAQARANARAVPAQAQLARNARGGWDGTLLLLLPAS